MIPDKRLTAIISIAGGADGNSVIETVTLENFRMSVDVRIYGGAAMGEMDCRIFGASLELMNKVTAVGPVMNQFLYRNLIEIKATNDSGGMSTIFTGNIAYAYGDLNSAPDAALMIHAVAGGNLSYKLAEVMSYAKPVSVATLMEKIASANGLEFKNFGVDVMLPPCYFDRDALTQIRNIAEQAGINWAVTNGSLYIWPLTGEISDPAQIIEVGRNMVGYPMMSSSNIFIRAEFLPFLRIGGTVQIKGSQVKAVNATWIAWQVSHELDSITPNGRWFTNVGMMARST